MLGEAKIFSAEPVTLGYVRNMEKSHTPYENTVGTRGII